MLPRGVMTITLVLAACSSAQWTDTLTGKDNRTTSYGDPSPDDDAVAPDGGPSNDCIGLANSSATVPITVTFPGHGTPSAKIHVVAGSKTCDVNVDTDTDGIVFASDAIPCASTIAAGLPSSGTATVQGPSDLLFAWSYSVTCTINDDYALSGK